MQQISEKQRFPAPGTRCQPLAFDGKLLWTASFDTEHLYALDPTGAVVETAPCPGKPYGLAILGDEMRAVVSQGAEDDRYFYRYIAGRGFDLESRTPCPQTTGSHFTSDGESLYLVQMHNQRLLVLDAAYAVKREIPLSTRLAGLGFAKNVLHVITADEDFDNLTLATLDLDAAEPSIADVAEISPAARSLAYDGTAWWTNYREENELVSFAL